MSTARPKVRSPHILTLVVATAAGPLAMNVFLPSLPAIARHYQADYSVVQLMVAVYLASTAVLQLGIGPLSDRFGRRRVMLASFAIFIAGTFASLYAPTIEALLACRVLQAFSAAGMVLSRAIVRDTVGMDEAASRMGYITMGMALAPMVGPVIGGFLDQYYGWQSTFVLTLGYAVVATAVIWNDLNETNLSPTSSFVAQFRAYPELLRSRRFWAFTLTAGFTSGAFFAFLGGGPYVATEMLGLGPMDYGLYFMLVSIGYMVGNFMSGRYARRLGVNRMMLSGNIVSTAGTISSIVMFASGFNHPIALFGPVALLGVGNGLTLPSANAGLVSVRPHLAGSASGLGGSLQIGSGAALAVIAGWLLTPQSGPYPLLVVMSVSAACAIGATLFGMSVDRRAGPLGG